jgi:hypothetical protein
MPSSFNKEFPEARLVTIDNAGQLMNMKQPEGFNSIRTRFLASVGAGNE